MATNKYYKNDVEFGLLESDINTFVEFAIPKDPLNVDDSQQRIGYVCQKYPELSKTYYAKKGERIRIPRYIYNAVVQNSYIIDGHSRPENKLAEMR